MATEKKDRKEQRRLQEIADRYGVFLYSTKHMIYGVGLARHDGHDCQRVCRAVKEAARA